MSVAGTTARLSVGVFASDKGSGDPERSNLMSQAGTLLARRRARLICLAEKGVIPVPLITAMRTAGGGIDILADSSIVLPPALSSVPITVLPEREQRYDRLDQLADAFIALPGSLASTSALFAAWSHGGGKKPVVVLNRNRAYEALRGFAGDVVSHSLPGHDRRLQFAETLDDLWGKLTWMLDQRRP